MTAQTAFDFSPKPTRRLTVLDLCCGAGMASLGFEAAGCEVIGGVDIWASAQAVLAAQYDGLPELVDYEDGDDVGVAVDIVITGPPCQDDSLANQSVDKGREVKLGPREAAALSGYPLMQFPAGLTDKELQTMVGNGWPKSFGLAIGRAIRKR